MIPSQFDYVAPQTVEEALSALAEAGDEGKVLAGGQSLLPILRLRMNTPETIVDLGRIADLREVSEDGDAIVIGATATHDDVRRHPLVTEHALLLAQTLAEVADPQVRHRGTVGGALVHADPAGDVGAAALALDAEMVIAGPSGRRTVAAEDFFVGLFESAVGEDELLVQVRVPKHTGWGGRYEKFVRTAQQWSIVAVAATLRVDGGRIADARVALTNMGATPLRARSVEQALVGQEPTPDVVRTAAASAAEGTDPPADLNGAADYRQHLAGVLTRRAVLAAAGV